MVDDVGNSYVTGSALQIDPRQFYTQLYGAIMHLDLRKYDVD